MPRFGVHASIAKGFAQALAEGQQLDCESLQIFTKTASQWQGKSIDPEGAKSFRALVKTSEVHPIASHNSYLINLASPDDTLWTKSLAALRDELERADLLGLDYLVMHPGAHVGTGEATGLARIASGLANLAKSGLKPKARLLFETTAGQGSTLGYRFEHLRELLDACPEGWNAGVCLDTCHILAAGYPLSPTSNYKTTMREFDKVVGLDELHFFHINDSVKPLGSRVDRHAHLGEGHVGEAGFRELVNDPRFQQHGMVLETAKEARDGESMDSVNLRYLRNLMAKQKSWKPETNGK